MQCQIKYKTLKITFIVKATTENSYCFCQLNVNQCLNRCNHQVRSIQNLKTEGKTPHTRREIGIAAASEPADNDCTMLANLDEI